jgi:hypothetical protein
MSEWYELWDVDAGNMIGAFANEAEALAEVRSLLAANGRAYADDLALARRRVDGGEPIADGDELARRAESPSPGRRSA